MSIDPQTPPMNNSGPPAGEPGLSPPSTPPAGVPPVNTDIPGQTPPATPPTTEPPVTAEVRVVPAADAYVLPPGTPEGLGKWANEHQFTQGQLDVALKQFSDSLEATKISTLANLKAQGEAHIASWGEKSADNLHLAKSALTMTDPEGKLKTLLRETGFANHPAVLDYLRDLGHQLREGGFLKSGPALPKGGKDKTVAQALYGNTHPSKS